MNYEEFKTIVKQEFMSYLPEEYQHLKMDIRPVEKVNTVKDGMSFLDMSKESNMSPTIYVEDMYISYQETEDYRKVFEDVAAVVEKVLKEPLVTQEKLDFHNVKDNIVFQLINTEQNKGLLNSLPHREFHDLSIIYRWIVGCDKNGLQSVVIKNDLMEKMGLNEEQMFKLAVVNYKRLLAPTIYTMDDVLRETLREEGKPEELAEIMLSGMTADEMMWFISNNVRINGACSMLYDDVMQEIAEKVDSDLYILPSSVHETIAVSVNMGDPYELAQMVSEVNMSQISLDERLSNQVYHYDKELHKLTMATNAPMKRLDGLVAEPQLIYGTDSRAR
ncbi:MAG: hypothetical protein IJZ34_11320 [Lachnospiraceae bacterium]|nr:hypothetical protein [Lachnospiraceae bacterium]